MMMTNSAQKKLSSKNFLDVIITQYFKAYQQNDDAFDEVIDLIEDSNFCIATRKNILKSVLKFQKSYPINDNHHQKINDLLQRIFPVPVHLSLINTPEEKVKQFLDISDPHKLDYILQILSKFDLSEYNLHLSFYLGEVLFLYKTNLLKKSDILYFWQHLQTASGRSLLSEAFKDIYDYDLAIFEGHDFADFFLENKSFHEDISSDWFIYMEEAAILSQQEIEEKFKTIF